ncbi:hypothetical protein HDU97_006822 [Phlyctochytrium planicorne]|nr:hypothetical protein HDU97_006822 [Phlyctochytrium planicorne]
MVMLVPTTLAVVFLSASALKERFKRLSRVPLRCRVRFFRKSGASPACDTDTDKFARIPTALGRGANSSPGKNENKKKTNQKKGKKKKNKKGKGKKSCRIRCSTSRIPIQERRKPQQRRLGSPHPPEVIPNNRKRTVEVGCAEIKNAFVCVDLARNARCIHGKVAPINVNPFFESNLLKAGVGGFCGGIKISNPCVGTAQQAVDGNRKGNDSQEEDFITDVCTSDDDCASGCCGFCTGKCAGAIIALQRDGGCGFGDSKPNDNAPRALGFNGSITSR